MILIKFCLPRDALYGLLAASHLPVPFWILFKGRDPWWVDPCYFCSCFLNSEGPTTTLEPTVPSHSLVLGERDQSEMHLLVNKLSKTYRHNSSLFVIHTAGFYIIGDKNNATLNYNHNIICYRCPPHWHILLFYYVFPEKMSVHQKFQYI